MKTRPYVRNAWILLCLAVAITRAPSQDFEEQIEARVKALVALRGTGTDTRLKQKLVEMGKKDQSVRTPEIARRATPVQVEQQQRTDRELTAALKIIVASKGWPTIRLVGLQASELAATILAHSPDHAFQRRMLPTLEKLADAEEILPSSVALIVDKILVAEGKPQRFGTQVQWKDGVAEVIPVETTEGLDERRRKYFLPPMAQYKKAFEEFYKMQVK